MKSSDTIIVLVQLATHAPRFEASDQAISSRKGHRGMGGVLVYALDLVKEIRYRICDRWPQNYDHVPTCMRS
jgi:hypothetical protein